MDSSIQDNLNTAQQQALLERRPPHSTQAEESVIGALLVNPDGISLAQTIIGMDDFYHRQYGLIFESMCELYEQGRDIDPVTLHNRLTEKSVPPDWNSLEFLGSLVAAVPMSSHLKTYLSIVAEKSVLRKLLKITEEISAACYIGKNESTEILEEAEKKIFGLISNKNENELVPIRKIVMSALERIEAAAKNHSGITGIATGFTELDHRTAGMQNSDLVLIAARPSMGKTAFALNIAENVAFRQNRPVVIFSLEMSREQLVNRLFSLESRVSAQNIRTGRLSDAEWGSLIESAGVIGKSKLMIDDTPAISVASMRSRCRKYKIEYGLDMIIIDYLQMMSGDARSESRQQEISTISRSLKALAREIGVPVLALSQLSRGPEQRPEHRPILSDLRDSGAIEQDADVAMLLYREDYYVKDTERKNIAEVIIAKQRNGPTGTVELLWMPEYTKFVNLETNYN